MKAAVLTELNQPLVVRDDIGLVDLGAGEVHIKIVSSGVCHSDVSAQNGTIPVGTPCVLGHEGAGIIQEVGAGVSEVAAGDPVIVSFTPACRVCKSCLRGEAYLCQAMGPMFVPHFTMDGSPIMGMTGCGTFAEEMIVPESAVVKVDKDIPLDLVSLIGCGVTTGVGAAINTAKVTPGSSVVVFGAGGVGISAIQGARIAGAAEILAVDLVDSKLNMAKQFGATHVCKPDDFEGLKNEITAGEGFDFALECIGNPVTIRATYDAARRVAARRSSSASAGWSRRSSSRPSSCSTQTRPCAVRCTAAPTSEPSCRSCFGSGRPASWTSRAWSAAASSWTRSTTPSAPCKKARWCAR